MEKLKPIHKHDLTNIIKVGMFALMLLLPFLVFLPNAFYYGFNEHATNETTTEVDIQYKFTTNDISRSQDLVNGNIYTIDLVSNEEALHNYIDEIDFIYLSFINYEYNNELYYYMSDKTEQLNLYFYNDNFYIGSDRGETNIKILSTSVDIVANWYDIGQDLSVYGVVLSNCNFNLIENVDVQTDIEQTITQQMYNSWQSMWQTPLFNWTTNSLLNTGLTAFCNGLGIVSTSYIANFLTYELVIVAIYIVLDIVLTLFTWLTHIGQKD